METTLRQLHQCVANPQQGGGTIQTARFVGTGTAGVIQGFELTHELAWNVLKDYLEEQGFVGIVGSRNATREAFRNGLLDDGETWMDMIKARNLTSHTYDPHIAEDVAKDILTRFHPAFVAMAQRFGVLAGQPETNP